MPVILRHSETAGSAPDPALMSNGQLDMNGADGKLYWRTPAGILVSKSLYDNLQETVPATPSVGITPFTKVRTGKRGLAAIDTYGIITEYQKDISRNRGGFHEMSWGNTSFSSLGLAGTSMSATGNVALANIGVSNFKGNVKRNTITGATANTAGINVGMRYSSARCIWRGNAPKRGGFSISCRVGIQTSPPAGYIFFSGVLDSVALIGATVLPTSQINLLGVCREPTDTNFQWVFNGSGTATKIDTGITPTDTTMYIITVSCRPFSDRMYIAIEDMETENITELEVIQNAGVTNIPSNTRPLSFQTMYSNNATAVTPVLDYGGYFGENV